MSLDPYKLPMGKQYRLRMTGCNTAFPGAKFVDGVTVEPVNWRDARRIAIAWGARACQIEFYSEPEPPPAAPEPEPAPEPSAPAETAPGPDLDALTRPELYDLASERGLDPHHRMHARSLRKLIQDAETNTDNV